MQTERSIFDIVDPRLLWRNYVPADNFERPPVRVGVDGLEAIAQQRLGLVGWNTDGEIGIHWVCGIRVNGPSCAGTQLPENELAEARRLCKSFYTKLIIGQVVD
jgi:hypothetical protein